MIKVKSRLLVVLICVVSHKGNGRSLPKTYRDRLHQKIVVGSFGCTKQACPYKSRVIAGVFTRISVKRCRLDNEIGAALGAQLDAEKCAGRPVRLVPSKQKCQSCSRYYAIFTGKVNRAVSNRVSGFFPCPDCHCNAYGLFPYWILNDNNEKVRVQLFHCVNCGYEPEVKEANLEV